jgi:ribosomal protein S18 acetylase RimI-like enzyme
MPVTKASLQDVPVLVSLVNSAYRGESSKKGWTTEADLLEGDHRTDIPSLTDLMNGPRSVVFKYTNEAGIIIGSVYVEIQERGLYLGMLSVSPLLQATGVGKQLMQAAEQYAREHHCPSIFMYVISVRHELIAWYERLGYRKTGETKPLPADNRFGVPTQPLEFAILEKKA